MGNVASRKQGGIASGVKKKSAGAVAFPATFGEGGDGRPKATMRPHINSSSTAPVPVVIETEQRATRVVF